jgi:hypothetical protein
MHVCGGPKDVPMDFSEVGSGWRGQDFVVILVFVVHFSLSQETATFLRSHNKLGTELVHNWVKKAVFFYELLDV